jgi:hypothetical protein
MSITTTESIKAKTVVRCSKCGKEARGGLLIGGLGICDAAARDAELLELMIPDDVPEPEPEVESFVAVDPLSNSPGATRIALRVIQAIQAKERKAVGAEKLRYRQAHAAAVKEVLAEELPFPPEPEPHAPSIPPPAGYPDPLLDEMIGVPGFMKLKATRQKPGGQ